MTIKIICKDCGRDLGTVVISGKQKKVGIEVHGCKCERIGFLEGFEAGKRCWQENYGQKSKAGPI